MENDDKLNVCKKYVNLIFMLCEGKAGFPDELDRRRSKTHDKIIELFECDPVTLETITANLDVWIAFPRFNKLFTQEDIPWYGQKLYNLLNSEFFKNADPGDIRKIHKELSQSYLDSNDFQGWASLGMQ